jgi:catechol 2,3-dioxygenase-like lactoylglutathione lyase family enzyme
MGRVQLALNVRDLSASIAFYEAYFGVPPAKVRPGYANFAVADPPLKLVLIESDGGPHLNHLGVEVDSSEEVADAAQRLERAGLDPRLESDVTCCYARQDKVWASAPDGEPWEVYRVLADAPAGLDACCGDGGAQPVSVTAAH